MATDLELVAKYVRVVMIGARVKVSINPCAIKIKELDVRGLALSNASRSPSEPIMDDLIAGLADGSLDLIIGVDMLLVEAASAYVRVIDSGAYGKLVLTI